LWVSGHLQNQPRKLPYYNQVSYVRIAGLALVCLAIFTVRNPYWLLAAFFASYGLYAMASGFGGLPFLEVIGKTIPPRRRGLFFAWRLTLGGLFALAATAAVRWLLAARSPLAFPYNFGALFILGTLMLWAGMWMLLLITEPPDHETHPQVSFFTQVSRALPLVRADRNYRRFLVLRVALLLASSASPFFAVYVQQQLGGPPEMVGIYLAVVTASGLVSNMVLGRFSMRLGNRRVLAVSAALGLVMSSGVLSLAWLARPLGLPGLAAALCLLPVYVLMAARDAGIGVASHSLLLDIAPAAERSLYLGFTNSILGVILFSTGLSGVVVEHWGFVVLVALTLAAYALALWAALRMQDARPGEMHAPREGAARAAG
jgi:Na+/melibiose symporter-like transporter